MGGLVQAVASGWLHREISAYNWKYQKAIESGEYKVVGVNYQVADDNESSRDIEVFEYPETLSRQKAKLDRLREERSDEKVAACLDLLRKKCHTKDNLYPYTIQAIKNHVTLGEIEEVFREEFGLWTFPLV